MIPDTFRRRTGTLKVFDRIITASLPLVPKPIVRRIARSYIAGESLDDLVAAVRELNAEGFMVATSILGEFVERREESEQAVRDYQEVLAAIDENGLDSNIHIKLTHFGLKLDKDFARDNLRTLLETAAGYPNFVRIDMEDSPCTTATLDTYYSLREEFDNVGVVIQARMRRSIDDVRALAKVRANVRLCKGIYLEPHDIAYTDAEIIRQNYTYLLEELLGAGCYVGIATHDERLVWEALRIIDRLGLGPADYEFQMLHGVLPELRRIIRDSGHRLRVGVPFGPSWYPYSVRRLRKNPMIARYVMKAMLGWD
jgi:proline dehydrogenase